jgi:hypothetical protein
VHACLLVRGLNGADLLNYDGEAAAIKGPGIILFLEGACLPLHDFQLFLTQTRIAQLEKLCQVAIWVKGRLEWLYLQTLRFPLVMVNIILKVL